MAFSTFVASAQDECKAGCPNYPCCLQTGEPCDDAKPCKKTTGGGGGTSSGGAITLGAPNDRVVYWIHGMEGSNKAWNVYYNKFTAEYKIHSSVADYTTANGATTGAKEVETENIDVLKAQNADLKDAFVIAHSMGGAITRVLDRDLQTNDAFGGYVTFGTPHTGSGLANAALDPNKMKKWLTDGVTAVLLGPSKSFFWPKHENYSAQNLTSIIDNNVITGLFKTWGGSVAMDDLKEGSPLLSGLNALPSNGKPKLVFAAVENRPTLWREVSSFVTPPSDLPLNVEKDGLVPTVVEVLKDIYNFNYNLNQVAMITSPLFKPAFAEKANAWLEGYKWLAESNGQWQFYLNSVSSIHTETYYTYKIEKKGWCNCKIVATPKQIVIAHDGPNDGVVKESSALALPDASGSRVLPGVNHQQCQNSNEATTALYDVMNGNINSFFATEPK